MDAALPRLIEVTVRCDRCARDLGPAAPAMAAVVARLGRGNDRWTIFTLERVNRRRHEKRLAIEAGRSPELREISAKLRDYRRSRYPLAPERNGRTDAKLRRRGVELRCRRCDHAPRTSRRMLYCLAEQAIRAGRHDAYV